MKLIPFAVVSSLYSLIGKSSEKQSDNKLNVLESSNSGFSVFLVTIYANLSKARQVTWK